MANLTLFQKRLIVKLILLAATIYFVLPVFRKANERRQQQAAAAATQSSPLPSPAASAIVSATGSGTH